MLVAAFPGCSSQLEPLLLAAPKLLHAVFAALTDYAVYQLAGAVYGGGDGAEFDAAKASVRNNSHFPLLFGLDMSPIVVSRCIGARVAAINACLALPYTPAPRANLTMPCIARMQLRPNEAIARCYKKNGR